MISTDEQALICDLAETYHVLDYKSLPLKTVATLSVGLRDNSRIKMKMTGMNHSLETLLLAAVSDRMANLVWMNSQDGAKGINRPKFILSELLGEEKDGNVQGYDSPEEFDKAWKERTDI